MGTLYIHELKRLMRTILLWSIIVGAFGILCIVMFKSMESEITGIADSFSSMGAFSDAFGLSTLSMATITGYFATEVGTIHGLGIGLFAATLATTILSKEEDLHTGEFLFSFPVSRTQIVTSKIFAVVSGLLIFTIICAALYEVGFLISGDSIDMELLIKFYGMQLVLGIEIASICFIISSISRTNKLGMGMGVGLCFYFFDLMARVVPDFKDYIGFGPYSYANASEIFANGEVEIKYISIGIVFIILSVVSTYVIYNRKDLAS